MHIDELYEIYLSHPQIETDTRKIKPGSVFFALKGPNFNGNHFIEQAFNTGAAFCITDEMYIGSKPHVIKVDDSLQCLQQLAKKHREQFKIPFLAITGSNGKTTTKELIHQVLSASFKTYTTDGNLNNHIGIPLTILKIKADAEIAVVEMGANHLGEIKSYCEYTQPTHGLITNCGKAHLEGFGGEEGVKKGKGELFNYLANHKGIAFLNKDLTYLDEMATGIEKKITYGSTDADYHGRITDHSIFLEVSVQKDANISSIKTQLVGQYNFANVMAAVAVGKTFGITDLLIKEALENYTPTNSRSQLIEKNGNKIIMDAYNANPSSMQLAIANFAALEGSEKILILGSMMELGQDADAEHQKIIQEIEKNSWKHVALTGQGYKNIPAHMLHFKNSAEAAEWFKKAGIQNAMILVKGSRSMQMEKLIE